MLIAVIGGKLQGVEAVYLAHKAGFRTLVIDKNPQAPAAGLSDHFLAFEFCSDHPFPVYGSSIDLILPAIEDDSVLSLLQAWSKQSAIPLAFDGDAYATTRSKRNSNRLFEKLNLPIPQPWPGCAFPVVVKPDQTSGSQGVEIMETQALLDEWLARTNKGNAVIQEFVEGPSYSIEILGGPGNYHPLQVTDLGMDEDWDCKNVSAPSQLSANHITGLKQMAIEIAEGLELTGIMDLEVILNQNTLKILEIDARLPSQTPMAVYWSTGINMVQMLADLVRNRTVSGKPGREFPVLVEHIQVSGGRIEYLGEHIMAQDGPLRRQTGFFGADEAVTSYRRGKKHWVATMIFRGDSRDEIELKRTRCYGEIRALSGNEH
ncbi:MAG: 3-methylornithine--L-lysine ligase PylC [Desulfobacter sp.]|nr:MAG: 3-methylornithine--L-lysine ligase PylC [Desulfobacter sp.]